MKPGNLSVAIPMWCQILQRFDL